MAAQGDAIPIRLIPFAGPRNPKKLPLFKPTIKYATVLFTIVSSLRNAGQIQFA